MMPSTRVDGKHGQDRPFWPDCLLFGEREGKYTERRKPSFHLNPPPPGEFVFPSRVLGPNQLDKEVLGKAFLRAFLFPGVQHT